MKGILNIFRKVIIAKKRQKLTKKDRPRCHKRTVPAVIFNALQTVPACLEV